MAINTSWKVEIGTVASPTNFTSRVMSMNIQQDVDVNVIGRGRAVFTLINKDGALTPGGGGTYSSTDWFAQGVFITALTNTGGADTSTAVFHGLVNDFDLVDDGVYSTVTITALDALTIGGKTTNKYIAFPASSVAYDYTLDVSVGPAFLSVSNYPYLGETSYDTTNEDIGGLPTKTITSTSTVFSTQADLVQTAVIPSANDTVWATTIERVTSPSTYTDYRYASLPFTNTRSVANQINMEFDPPGSLSGSKLPFDVDSFQQAFNNDTLITTATIQGLYTGATSVTANASTLNTYGNRTASFTSTFVENATEASSMATKLVNRYSVSRFGPVSLQTSASLVKRLAADAAQSKWYSLLGIKTGLWQKATITWTGSGASSQTANCVIRGRTINVTPSDTVVTLNLTNWVDNHGFILDTDKLNVDRLG